MNKNNKRFNKKQAVRFLLVPGRDENGNPTTTFKPVETRNKLSKRQREKIISQVSDYQIEIDGQAVDESEIPAYVLEQIKGRADLIFNRNNPNLFNKEEEEGEQEMMEEDMDEGEYQDEEQGELIPEEEYMGCDTKQQQIKDNQEQKQVDLDGKKYKLTKNQLKMLDQVLPKDYENYQIEGVEFVKYNEDGNRLDQKESYQKYIADPLERRGIIDSFQFVPEKHVDVVDNDMQGQVLKGDMKQIEDALNYQGEEGAYQELEDDFFSQLIGGENKGAKTKVVKQKENQGDGFKKKKPSNNLQQVSQPKVEQKQSKAKNNYHSKLDQLEGDEGYDSQGQYDEEDDQWNEDDEQITDQMLDKAIEQFDRKHQKNEELALTGNRIPGTGVPVEMKGMSLIEFIESREGCTGKDGQLDWRTLTKKQKKQYMKNKKIREAHQEVRQRQIKQKLQGKQNVNAEDLHLKKYVQHIPYNEDHVMQEAIERDQKEEVKLDEPQLDEDFQTDSDQDDIVSYRAKTSVISSNLATVEEVGMGKKKKKEKQLNQEKQEQIKNIEKVKVVPQKRNRNETAEERKQRKEKLKQMKKEKKQQRMEFNEIFETQRKKVMKRNNNTSNNPLHKVAYVKIV